MSTKIASKKATRDAYGETLCALGAKHSNIVVLDADLSGSTKTSLFKKDFPERFYNVGVAEQNLVGMAAGFSISGLVPFASSFAMFLAGRAWEITRNSIAYPHLNVKLVATHSGITVGEDGASHQCLEDIAIMRVLPGMHVFVPADATETSQIIERAYEIQGPCYIRCGRSSLPILDHHPNYKFQEGKIEILNDGSDITIIACGVMVSEAQQAVAELANHGIEAALLNVSSIKPIDKETLLAFAKKTKFFITAEEHNVIGGLGSAVLESIAEVPIPVHRIGMQDEWGQTGDANTLLDYYGLRAANIVQKALTLWK